MNKRSPIFITRSGYDPEVGLHVKDPNLDEKTPTLGACRPDLRKKLNEGDFVFAISGKIKGYSQYIMGGFQVAEIISPIEAYNRFPHMRLKYRPDGQIDGNIIVNSAGAQHMLDHHDSRTFSGRAENYIVGRNPIVMLTPSEIQRSRENTMEILAKIFDKTGEKPRDIIGRMSKMNERQVQNLIHMLQSLKSTDVQVSHRKWRSATEHEPKNIILK